MNFVNSISEHWAERINNHAVNATSVAVLKFALINILNTLTTMIIVLLVCIFRGDIVPGLIAFFAFPLLRYFSGGLHFRSSMACNIVSAILILMAVYVPIPEGKSIVLLSIISMLCLALYAPSGIQRSKLPSRFYPLLKLVSIVIVASNIYISSPLLAKVFLIQSLTTIRALQRFTDRYKL
jgi:accessory gene regulator B